MAFPPSPVVTFARTASAQEARLIAGRIVGPEPCFSRCSGPRPLQNPRFWARMESRCNEPGSPCTKWLPGAASRSAEHCPLQSSPSGRTRSPSATPKGIRSATLTCLSAYCRCGPRFLSGCFSNSGYRDRSYGPPCNRPMRSADKPDLTTLGVEVPSDSLRKGCGSMPHRHRSPPPMSSISGRRRHHRVSSCRARWYRYRSSSASRY